MIGWEAESCFVILLEEEYLHMIGWSEWPMTGYKMISQCSGILGDSRSRIAPVNLNGVL